MPDHQHNPLPDPSDHTVFDQGGGVHYDNVRRAEPTTRFAAAHGLIPLPRPGRKSGKAFAALNLSIEQLAVAQALFPPPRRLRDRVSLYLDQREMWVGVSVTTTMVYVCVVPCVVVAVDRRSARSFTS